VSDREAVIRYEDWEPDDGWGEEMQEFADEGARRLERYLSAHAEMDLLDPPEM
jgi:hypothetical protein